MAGDIFELGTGSGTLLVKKEVVIIGCGCGGNKSGAAASGSSNRLTIYQVITGNTVLSEFNNLRDARAEALVKGGRVKVTSKTK